MNCNAVINSDLFLSILPSRHNTGAESRSCELRGGGHDTPNLQSQGKYSEWFNSDVGAPYSTVNGFPLHLLSKSLPLKGSFCFAMNLNLLLCFFASASVTGGASCTAERQVLPIPIEPSLAAPVPHSLFPATPCLARAVAYAALWYGFRGECRFKNK